MIFAAPLLECLKRILGMRYYYHQRQTDNNKHISTDVAVDADEGKVAGRHSQLMATSMYFLMDSQGTEKVITETHREGDH